MGLRPFSPVDSCQGRILQTAGGKPKRRCRTRSDGTFLTFPRKCRSQLCNGCSRWSRPILVRINNCLPSFSHAEYMTQLTGRSAVGMSLYPIEMLRVSVADDHLESTYRPWDICAGSIIAQEAGCLVAGSLNSPLDNNVSEDVLAGRKHIVIRAIGDTPVSLLPFILPPPIILTPYI